MEPADAPEDGLERLRRWREQARGVPPAFGRLGARLEVAGRGATVARLPLADELLLPDGSSTAAVTSLVADFGLTTAVIAALPDLQGVTTVALTVDHLALPPRSGELVATCRSAPTDGDGPRHAAGTVHDGTGRPVAAVSAWLLPAPAEPASVDRTGLVREPPATSLLDLLQVAAGPVLALHARDALSNALGTLHGGIGALASQLAAEAALQEALGHEALAHGHEARGQEARGQDAAADRRQLRALRSTTTFLRPAPRDGSVTVTGSVVRRGRRTGLATGTVTGADGRDVLRTELVVG